MFSSLDFHNKIAKLSIETFQSLPKTGKPNNQEWTILSTIVIYDNILEDFNIVALGTGSKCIGQNSMSNQGDILNDSHAEIICRRAFLKYIYNEIESFLSNNKSSILIKTDDNKLGIKESITFHFFSSHVPCGDAAIFPKDADEDYGVCLVEKVEDDGVACKKRKIDDIHRTGAKCLKDEEKQDMKLPGFKYHTTGAIRTKPGRGDPTLSVSCSDKISKWTYVGIQGTLLSYFLENPIYLSTITIAANVQFSEESMTRAIYKRFDTVELPIPYKQMIPSILQSDVDFNFSKDDSKQPCPSSIIWYKNCGKIEVSVDGKKQGVTKKNKHKKSGRLKICKKELFDAFVNIINGYDYFKNLEMLKSLCYIDVKEKNSEYTKVWDVVKTKIFKVWTVKNRDLLKFYCYD